MLLFEWTSRFETLGYKLAEGKGLREGWDWKELWKSVEKVKGSAGKPTCKRSRFISPRTLGPAD